MHHVNKPYLKEMDWKEHEIKKTLKIVKKVKKSKSNRARFIENHLFNAFIVMGVAGNVLIAVALAHLMIPNVYFYWTLLLIAFCFGSLFATVIEEMSYLKHNQHVDGMFITAISTFIILITIFSMQLELPFNIFQRSAFITALLYSLAFGLPYVFVIRKRLFSVLTDTKHA